MEENEVLQAEKHKFDYRVKSFYLAPFEVFGQF